MVLIFTHPLALNHLLKKGRVYTLRSHKRKGKERDWVTRGRGKKAIADVKTRLLLSLPYPFHPHRLAPYVNYSGFKSPEEWYEALVKYIGYRRPYRIWLYDVRLLNLRVNVEKLGKLLNPSRESL